MNGNFELNDIANETLVVIEHFEFNLIKQIPQRIINYLKELAIESKKNYKIDENKSLANQDISEQSKDLISYIYYSYIANEEEKKEIEKKWDKNEIEYIKELNKKYNYDELFNKKKYIVQNVSSSTEIAEYKENVFTKIKKMIFKIFGKKVRK